MNKNNPQVDGYIRKNKQWQAELNELRRIVLDSPLVEEVKWRVPVYTLDGKNVAFMGSFKESCAFSFTKGVLLKDPKKILEMPGENTQSARVIRFKNVEHILENEPALRALIKDAIKVEESGQKVAFKKTAEFAMPEEFQAKLDELPALKKAFAALTPGRQRAYLLHFSGAKQSATRASRVEKWMPQILKGKGIDDE
jgi:uncharacterized protein YdeI (YjbR/CyaY-like superfamily)